MKIPIISIGNSKGIRLSKMLIDKYKITDSLEVILEKDHVILKPKSPVRQGWEKSFKKMHQNGDDNSFLMDVFEDENFG